MPPSPPARRSGGALAVAAGIFLSRIAGLVRERAIAHYLGQTAATDAFRAALRIPNFLQNLLGEGVLSASFIPVYARLLAEGRIEEASRVARAIGTLLGLVASTLALVGIIAARPLVHTLIPGSEPAIRELTVQLVQIMFPGVVLLVMSAWCLGVLNSHRRFFLSYVSPVLWNAALIATAILAGRRYAGHDDEIAVWLGWGAVIGSAAQFLVQLPTVIALLRGGLRPSLAVRDDGVRATLRAFVPVLFGRGSVQISAYIDQALASYLGKGIVSAMANAQVLYTLPVSLFGMAVSAAELPEMSSATGGEAARAEHLQNRLGSALRRVTFLVVPSAIAFVTIGGSIVALLFQTGKFTAHDTQVVWIILCGSAIGLVPSTLGRLLASGFYALGDPKPPLRAALVRVGVNATLGFLIALPLRDALGYSGIWGAVADAVAQRPPETGYVGAWFAFGLMAGSGVAAWIEFALLRRWLANRIGAVPIPTKLLLGTLAAALLAGGAAYGTSRLATHLGVYGWLSAAAAIGVFGVLYLGISAVAQVPEANAFTRRLLRRR